MQHPDEVEAVAKAIQKIGRPMLLSLSPGGTVDPEAIDFFRLGNMLRVTPDVWDEQKYIDLCFDAWRKWEGKEQPGFWIDMDMIPFGQLQLMSPPSVDGAKTVMDKGDVALAGKGVHRQCQLTKPQMKTFITMRAMAASPLMMGGDLPSLDEFSLMLITDPEMLACNQNGVMGSLMMDQDGFETWKVNKRGTEHEGWIAVFNRRAKKSKFDISPERMGLDSESYGLMEVWSDDAKPFGRTTTLNPHGVLFVKFTSK